jgi:uncharacterized protein YbjT (DUF2867 family)
MTTHGRDITLLTGGTGKTGRRIAERLDGVAVRVGSRSGEPPFDWEDQTTWEPALRDVSAAYISYYPDLAVPGAAATVEAFAQLAVAQGVHRLVLLSGRGEEEAQHAEALVQAAAPGATIVRCSWFAQNFNETSFAESVAAGELALPVGDVPEPFVDAEDIADVAVAALTEDGHAGKLYELTGPRPLTFEEAVAEIAAATGRPVQFVPVTLEEYSAFAAAEGVPGDVIWLLGYLFGEVLDGRNVDITDGVQRALGRAPRDFRDFARDAAAAGAWS